MRSYFSSRQEIDLFLSPSRVFLRTPYFVWLTNRLRRLFLRTKNLWGAIVSPCGSSVLVTGFNTKCEIQFSFKWNRVKSTIWDSTDYLDSFLSISPFNSKKLVLLSSGSCLKADLSIYPTIKINILSWNGYLVTNLGSRNYTCSFDCKRRVYNNNILTVLFSINGMLVTVYISSDRLGTPHCRQPEGCKSQLLL